jgi:hypothetical protein
MEVCTLRKADHRSTAIPGCHAFVLVGQQPARQTSTIILHGWFRHEVRGVAVGFLGLASLQYCKCCNPPPENC